MVGRAFSYCRGVVVAYAITRFHHDNREEVKF
jgi:hypothetical protein